MVLGRLRWGIVSGVLRGRHLRSVPWDALAPRPARVTDRRAAFCAAQGPSDHGQSPPPARPCRNDTAARHSQGQGPQLSPGPSDTPGPEETAALPLHQDTVRSEARPGARSPHRHPGVG